MIHLLTHALLCFAPRPAAELLYDKGSQYEFTSLVRELDPPGSLGASREFAFDFGAVDKLYESYAGLNVKLRYFLRVFVARQYASNMVKEVDLWVLTLDFGGVSVALAGTQSLPCAHTASLPICPLLFLYLLSSLRNMYPEYCFQYRCGGRLLCKV